MRVSFRKLYHNTPTHPASILRRTASTPSTCITTSRNFMTRAQASRSPRFSFGVVSDIQYADRPLADGGNRFELDAINKLKNCVTHWRDYHHPLKCVVNLGDIIDGHNDHVSDPSSPHKDEQDLQLVIDAFNLLDVPKYHVLGNHCVWNLGCEYLTKKLGMTSRYYDVSIHDGWRFVFLDGTDMSLMKDSFSRSEAQEYIKDNAHRLLEDWNGGIGIRQRMWLENVVNNAKASGEKLIVFCHWPIVNLWGQEMEGSLLWNAHDIIPLLDPEVVFMYMSGHIHENGHLVHNGVHHVTLSGVVEAPLGENAHAIVHIHDDEVEVEGYGTVGPLSKVLKLDACGADL